MAFMQRKSKPCARSSLRSSASITFWYSIILSHSERQYKRKIADWKLDKNIKDPDMRIILRKQLKRKLESGKDSEFTINGRPVPPEKMSRFVIRKALAQEEILAEQMSGSFLLPSALWVAKLTTIQRHLLTSSVTPPMLTKMTKETIIIYPSILIP
jgi:hypothetical protein